VQDGFPFFVEMQWYALDRYVSTLMPPERSSQSASDQAPTRKHLGRKKLKVGGDGKRTPGDDGDADESTGDNGRNDESDAHLAR